MCECSNLQKLPTSIRQLNALQNLDLDDDLSLQELPTSIGQLNALENLDLWGFSSLQELLTSIEGLFELARITHIYWGIKCTPKPSFE